MDLIGALSQQLGVDSNQAQGLAGGLLGVVQAQVKDKLGDGAAQQLSAAVPELAGWQQAAQAAPAPSTGGDMLGALTGALGGQGGGVLGALGGLVGGSAGQALQQAGDVAAVAGVLQRFNLGADKAALVAPLLLNFLKSKLDPALVSKVVGALPMLAGLVGGAGAAPSGAAPAAGGGAAGLLSGLLK